MKKTTLLIMLCFVASAAKAQNSCSTAVAVTAGLHVVGTIDGNQASPTCLGNLAANAEWYSYTPTENHNVTVTTDLVINTGGDTRFHVYNGTCGALNCIGGDDDDGIIVGGSGSYLSVETFAALVGNTYYIAFDNNWSSNGFTFELKEGPYVEPLLGFTSQQVNLTGFYKMCVVDMNGDYLDDIVSVNSNQINILKQNVDGGFTSETIPTQNANFQPSWSIAAGDYDNNGFNDLLYGDGTGVSFMKANDTGTAYTLTSGSQYVFSQRSNFVDINNDGHLDAFVCHDVAPNVYYLNDGTGNLVFHQGGLGDFPTGGNYGSIWVDYDNDGDQDLFIAKCRGGNSGANVDELHQNNGSGVFTNVSVAAGMNEISQSWSSAWGDFDNDGFMDAVIGISSSENGGHKVKRNNGDGTFTDVTTGSGWDSFTGTNHENVAHDFNNDGFVDVFTASNTIMMNLGGMVFSPTQVTPTNGAIGDLNDDGFLDIQNGNTIYFNTGNNYNWIKISLQGTDSNRNGIGARVEIYGAFGKQIRDVRSGDGFEFMSSLNVHFGIGEATEITKVVVKWPSGAVDTILNPTINKRLFVLENSTLGVAEASNTFFSVHPNPADEVINITFNSNTTASQAEIFDINGRSVLKTVIKNLTIDVNSLSTGTYILSLKDTDGKNYTQKFIKK